MLNKLISLTVLALLVNITACGGKIGIENGKFYSTSKDSPPPRDVDTESPGNKKIALSAEDEAYLKSSDRQLEHILNAETKHDLELVFNTFKQRLGMINMKVKTRKPKVFYQFSGYLDLSKYGYSKDKRHIVIKMAPDYDGKNKIRIIFQGGDTKADTIEIRKALYKNFNYAFEPLNNG